MRAVVTRVKEASVSIDDSVTGSINKGFLILLGAHENDTEDIARKIADKICGLRVFEDPNGKMNINPMDAGAELLIVSQFTLYADCKSRRPGFSAAARPDKAIPLYELVISEHTFKIDNLQGDGTVTFVFLPGSSFDMKGFRFE